ncbi:iron-sulfur flavoprotein, putative [Entamoeba histolytica HM-3:IMSS]|uniref:Ironsulfur flavoprotein, putative n=2 Tax=Entamoeba histolytica TaxID=5759 RepID=M2S9K2_ENTHI|nr:ironsulfur flavoprotein, putative [Entamoeba histolytica KU27]EMS14384.1 iron-sulfur flavoprotein, putative [Entamoeba histolytica HM-3:IMSS]
MVVKVLVLLGSYRENSSSSLYAKAFLEGLSSKTQIESKTINLAQKKLDGCTGCYACSPKESFYCVIKDGFEEVMQEVVDSDIVIFAYPVYWYAIPGEIKNFVDRTVCLFDMKTYGIKPSLKDNFSKKLFVCISNSAEEGKSICERAAYPVQSFVESYGAKYQGVYLSGTQREENKNQSRINETKQAGIKAFNKL